MKSPATGKLRLGVVTLVLSCLVMTLSLRLPESAPAPLKRLFNNFAPEAEASAPHFVNGKLAFQTQRTGDFEIFLMNPDGTNPVNLTNTPGVDGNPHWSLDGTKIAFDSKRDGNSEIYVMNADGTNQTRLTFSALIDGDPSFSPDGTKIAFQSQRTGNFEIFVMNADGSNQTQLTNAAGNDIHATFSPDGSKIAFTSNRDGNAEIYIMNADGSNETRLTNNPTGDQAPSFSPNGKKIAFQRHINGTAQIMTMNPDGSNQTQLTSNSGSKFTPAFSADGNSISFTAGTNNDEEIFIMRADGTGQNQITSSVGDDISAAWQYLPAPDTVGVYRPSTKQFLLRNSNTTGSPDITFTFGQAGDLPIAGDWNGDGIDDAGVFRNGQFLLRQPITFLVFGQPHTAIITITLNFGQAGDLPVVGDWNGDGIDTVGVYRPSVGQWLLSNGPNTNNSSPPVDFNFFFGGAAGDQPLAGDWDGDGDDTPGFFRTGTFFLANLTNASDPPTTFSFGAPTDLVFAGDWDGNGTDTVAVFRNGAVALNLTNTANDPGLTFVFGTGGDVPLSGEWDGR